MSLTLDSKEIKLKKIPQKYDVYIQNRVSEDMLNSFKREINNKISEIDDIIEESIEQIKSLGFNIDNFQPILPTFNIHVSTYGGDVYAGLGICDIITNLSKRFVVNIICSGHIMSMGIPIILSGTNIYAYENTSFMIHEIASGSCGKLSELKEDIKEIERLNHIVNNIITTKTKIHQEELNDWYAKKMDVYLSTSDALKYGIITKII